MRQSHWVIVFVLLFAPLASAQSGGTEQPTGEARSDNGQDNQGVPANGEQRAQPPPARVTAGHNEGAPKHHANRSENNWQGMLSVVADIGMVLLTVGLLWAAYGQVRVSRRLGRDQLTLNFPPRLRATRPRIWTKPTDGSAETRSVPPRMIAGERIGGRIWAINYGRESAVIVDTDCVARWYADGVPMDTPYPNEVPGLRLRLLHPTTGEPVTELAPGEIGRFFFECEVPHDFKGKKDKRRLYVLGMITFRDRLDTHRAVFFARRYSLKRKRFVYVKDPEYESEE